MKKIKVFLWGERLKDIYPYATRWEVFKFRCRKFLRKVLVVASISILAGAVALQFFPRYKIVDKIVSVDNLSTKVVELKDEVLNDLRDCESGGFTEDDGLIVFDSNKRASIGLYQFQKTTVIYYYKQLYQQEITGIEAIKIALDEELSRKLAEDIIFNDKKGIDNWLNCKNKKGLADNIAWINKIIN